jgi:hypothetical protein
MARAERFLAQHLGGRYEPMEDEKMSDSTAIVEVIGNLIVRAVGLEHHGNNKRVITHDRRALAPRTPSFWEAY